MMKNESVCLTDKFTGTIFDRVRKPGGVFLFSLFLFLLVSNGYSQPSKSQPAEMYGLPYQEWNKLSEAQKRSTKSAWEERQGKVKKESDEEKRRQETRLRLKEKQAEAFNFALLTVGGILLAGVIIGVVINKIMKMGKKPVEQRPEGNNNSLRHK
jgi:hypothetical protein